ncbi:MAG: hypothetical protein QXJ31_05150 [Candidatus Bathyarchaeia archaeon]
MKIKEVRIEKLFSLENYNNERIGFVAEVEEGENADAVAGQLFLKIMNVEDCLQTYRDVLSDLLVASHREYETQCQIARHDNNETSWRVCEPPSL